MDFGHGFAIRRELGQTGAGDWLPFEALTAIHYVHRLAAYAVLAALAALAWRLHALRHSDSALGRWAAVLAAVAALQLLTGLSNVILDWPLVAAVAHTGGAAALVTLLAVLAVRAYQGHAGGRVAPAS